MEKMTVTPDMIVMHGKTTRSNLGDTEYIVFVEKESVYIVGTKQGFERSGEDILIYPSYMRPLARSLEEFYGISVEQIEGTAYGAWMDGAR